ncbi:MAG: winged helix-turn-helix domain-containing protein [Dorea sp.]|nr:winged helix-turn-helix domain-containing protein [Dorea sp.]
MISSTRSTISRIMKDLIQEEFIKIIDRYIYFS